MKVASSIAVRTVFSKTLRAALAILLAGQVLSAGMAEIERLFDRPALAELQTICRGSGNSDPAPVNHPEANTDCNCYVACSGSPFAACKLASPTPEAAGGAASQPRDLHWTPDSLRDFLSDRIHQPRSPPRAA